MIVRGKCPYSEFFWSVFSHMETKYGEILCPNVEKYVPEELQIRTLFTQEMIHKWRPWKTSNFQDPPPLCPFRFKTLPPPWSWTSNLKRTLPPTPPPLLSQNDNQSVKRNHNSRITMFSFYFFSFSWSLTICFFMALYSCVCSCPKASNDFYL